jgi:hypothetical protein
VSSATLVQILLPLHDQGGFPHPPSAYMRVRQELTRLFGVMNAYSRVPAEASGLNAGTEGLSADDLVVYEVMAERLESGWWHAYRSELERRFHQAHIVVRAQAVEVL